MAKATASATISFGLISIPSKVYLSASAERMSFNMITKNGNRVKQQLIDSVTEEVVERSATKHGYEIEKNNFVIFDEQELKALEGEKANVIEICSFLTDFKIKPTQVEKAYYLAPDKNADKPYKLLLRALSKSNRIAICKWYSRGRDHLVALVPAGDVLMMFQMYYASELRSFEFEFAKNSEPNDKEIELANRLMDQLSNGETDLNSFSDQYSERVKTAIAKKQAGETFTLTEGTKPSGALDLAALLESSLQQKVG